MLATCCKMSLQALVFLHDVDISTVGKCSRSARGGRDAGKNRHSRLALEFLVLTDVSERVTDIIPTERYFERISDEKSRDTSIDVERILSRRAEETNIIRQVYPFGVQIICFHHLQRSSISGDVVEPQPAGEKPADIVRKRIFSD